MSYIIEKMKTEATAESTTDTSAESTTSSNSSILETSLTSSDDTALKEIINDEYSRRGIALSDLPAISTTSIVSQGLISLFERVAEIQAVQKAESSVLTARKNTTLYNQLVQHTDEIVMARPAKTETFVKIPFSEIIKHGKTDGPGKYLFTYTTDNSISIDNKQFIPEYDVELLLTKTSIKTEVEAQYITDSGNVNIPTQKGLDSDGNNYVVIKVPLVQYTVEVMERTFSGSQLDKFILETTYPISDFFVTYTDSTTTTPISINAKLYYTRTSNNFIKYRIHSNTKISLEYIAGVGTFTPISGGKLHITLFTTTGLNSTYRSDASIIKKSPSNLNVEYLCVGSEYNSTGGTIASDDKEYIRSHIIKLKGTVLRIDTESDLATYMQEYTGNSTFKPSLVVNDIRRIFNIYTLMSFEDNKNVFTVPTTSGDIYLDLDNLTKKEVLGTNYYNMLNLKIESTQSATDTTFKQASDTPTPPLDGETVYSYAVPFQMTYLETENYVRCLSDSSYNTPYDTLCSFDSDNSSVPTRFVNTTIRMNNYEDSETLKRVFFLSTDIRSDNTDFPIGIDTFDAEIIMKDVNNNTVKVPLTKLIDQGKDNKFTLQFELVSDRKVYNRYFELTAFVSDDPDHPSVFTEKTVLLDIQQDNTKLNLYTIQADESITNPEPLLVSTFEANVSIFVDISSYIYLQSVVTMYGQLKLPLCPLVEYEFYNNWRNRKNINDELNGVFSFLDEEIRTDENLYNETGYNLKDRQETLFSTSVKFVKTHGRSKFLQLKQGEPLTNLQVSLNTKYRLLNSQFDLNRVSSEYNEFLTSHDFVSSDLHMNELVSDLLSDYSSDLQMLQFVSFGEQYDDTDHLISHNDLNYLNDDVPESVSLRPVYSTELGVYTYDVNYEEI